MQRQHSRAHTRVEVKPDNIIYSALQGRNKEQTESCVHARNLTAIPNFLGEGFAEAMEKQCVALFAAVAVEKDPVKRFMLKLRRDNLLVELSRLRDDKAKAARHIRRHTSDSAANSPRSGWGETSVSDAEAANAELPWYCRAPEGDPLRDAVDTLARRCVAVAKKDGRDCRDIFAAALYHFANLLDKDPGLPCAKLVNRSVVWAQHHILREDFAEHNARERGRDAANYRKWTWRLTDEVVEAVWPGLRKAFKEDASSAEADAKAFVEDITD